MFSGVGDPSLSLEHFLDMLALGWRWAPLGKLRWSAVGHLVFGHVGVGLALGAVGKVPLVSRWTFGSGHVGVGLALGAVGKAPLVSRWTFLLVMLPGT